MEEYPSERRRYALQNLIDSHDTDRVASMIGERVVRVASLHCSRERFDYDVGPAGLGRVNWDKLQGPQTDRGGAAVMQRMVAVMQATFVGAPMIYYGTEAGMWGADDPCDRKPMVWPDLNLRRRKQADPLGRERDPAR